LTFGAKEMESGNLSVRTLDGKVKMGVSRESFLKVVKGYIENRELELNPDFS
jgi:threonyl-tRNA synthetase